MAIKDKKPTGRKGFTPETKTEALRMLAEEGKTQKEVAEIIGCSLASIQQWKGQMKNGKPSTKKARRGKKKASKKTKGKALVSPKHVVTEQGVQDSFGDFIGGYWDSCPHAAEILALSGKNDTDVARYINHALRHAYEKLR